MDSSDETSDMEFNIQIKEEVSINEEKIPDEDLFMANIKNNYDNVEKNIDALRSKRLCIRNQSASSSYGNSTSSDADSKTNECSKCGYRAQSKKYLMCHSKFHSESYSNSKLYKCSTCFYITDDSNHYQKHIQTHPDYSSFENETEVAELELMKCSECEYETCEKDDLEIHVKSHSESSKIEHLNSSKDAELELLKCYECYFETNSKDEFEIHLETHSGSDSSSEESISFKDTESESFKCSECDYETSRKFDLQHHLRTHSDSKNDQTNLGKTFIYDSLTKLFECRKCGFAAEGIDEITSHSKLHDSKFYKCSDCDFETKYESKLKTHSQEHANPKVNKCSKCDYETKNESYLEKHLLSHYDAESLKDSDEALFKCSECDFKTNRKDYLSAHYRIHAKSKLIKYPVKKMEKIESSKSSETELEEFKCSECDFITDQKHYLRRHSKIHFGKLLKCSECNYVTRVESYLTKHTRRHLNPNPKPKTCKCFKCGWETYENRLLIQHLRQKHSSAWSLKCPDCDYVAKTKSYLKSHHSARHVKKLFKCTECNFETNDEVSLCTHEISH